MATSPLEALPHPAWTPLAPPSRLVMADVPVCPWCRSPAHDATAADWSGPEEIRRITCSSCGESFEAQLQVNVQLVLTRVGLR
jgi:hypothetical protein